jgi:hypothetical protein
MENTCDWRSRLLEMMLVKERDPGGGGALVSVWDKFAVDSPLEEAVSSEPLSESPGKYRESRRFGYSEGTFMKEKPK